MFTLVGGGIKKISDTLKPMSDVLPKEATWLKDEAFEFSPKENVVKTKKGDTITYDYLLIAVGLQPNFDKVKY